MAPSSLSPSHLFLFEQQICPWISSAELAAQGEENYAEKARLDGITLAQFNLYSATELRKS
jgi:hypothetical protein